MVNFAKYDGDALESVNIITKTLVKGINTVSQTIDFIADYFYLKA